MPRDLPSGTVTLLFTDIEGSTALLRELGTAGYADALAEHRHILRAAFSAEGGVEVDTQGDAFFVSFPTAAGAIAASASAQEALEAGPITVRMGLHTGTPTVAAEGYVGIDVHRGARVAALAHGGQVILTAATAALADDIAFRDLGRHRLKDFEAPAQLFQLGHRDFPPLRTAGAVDLPIPATRFLGRESELLDAAALWLDRDPRLLTIIGPGGTGKTRFAIELARFLADEADGGTVFVPLAPVRDAALVVPRIAAALGASEESPAGIATRLGQRQTHVVLDNLEQLLPNAAAPIADLLATASVLRLVATSREPLRIAGETELDLPPMGERDAVSLFLERAQAIRADIGDSPGVHELVQRLDHLPLAIELAAARVKLLRPEQLLERIAQRLDLLKGGRDADERHATLRTTISWSYDLLDVDEQGLFARLAIFRGGATLEDAEQVCDADLDTLASLLDKSLVRRRTDSDGEERFWMLEMIREFARERLDESGEEDALRAAQANRLIALATRAGTTAVIDVPMPWDFDLIAPEIDNIRAVLEWSVESDPERGLHLAGLLESFWVVRDPLGGATWLRRLLAAAPDADPRLRAVGLRALGGSLDIYGDHAGAAPCYQESLVLFMNLRDEPGAAHLRFRIASNMVMQGDSAAAWPLLEASLAEARRLATPIAESQALGFLVGKARAEGDVELALSQALESARLAQDAGWMWWAAGQLDSVADIERDRGRLDEAEACALRAYDIALGLGDRQRIVFSGAGLAAIAALRGDAARAGELWGAVEAETGAAPVGQWDKASAEVRPMVLRVNGPVFDNARERGRLLSVPDAIALGRR